MSNKDDNIRIGLSIFVAITIIPLTIFSGFVITKLWMWFVIPAFGLQPLSIPLALGLGTLVSYFAWRQKDSEVGETTKDFIKAMMVIYIRPALFLLIGWIYSWFI